MQYYFQAYLFQISQKDLKLYHFKGLAMGGELFNLEEDSFCCNSFDNP